MLLQYSIVTLIDADETTLCTPLDLPLLVPAPTVFNLDAICQEPLRAGEEIEGESEID